MPAVSPEPALPAAPAAPVVLVVDDHHVVRVGMRALVEGSFGARVRVEEADRIEDVLAYLERHARDVLVLLLDLHLADTHGLTGLHLVRQRHPALPVVVVTGSDNPRVREEAASHGALAFFAKAGTADASRQLLETVASLLARAPGGRPVDAAGARREHPGVRLTQRQLQVLDLVLAGHDNRAIAHETGLALGSVKNCVSSVFLAFNVRSRAELIRLFANGGAPLSRTG